MNPSVGGREEPGEPAANILTGRTTCPRGFPVASDHRVEGSSPAGCKYNSIKDLISIFTAKIRAFLAVY